MKVSSIFYCIKQGFINIKRNKLFSVASVGTIAACIFLMGLFYAVLSNIQYMVNAAEKNVSIVIFFDYESTQEEKDAIADAMSKRAEYHSHEYISAEQAWEDYKNEYFKDQPELAEGFKDDNPLANSDSFKVTLNDVSMQDVFVDFVQDLDGVRKVNYSDSTADALTDFGKIVGFISIAIIIILLAVGIFLISNTVMIGIAVRKEEIGIMKLMGARDIFIRAPFMVEGVMIGLVGAALPLLILLVIYEKVIKDILDQFGTVGSHMTLLSTNEIFSVLVPAAFIIGGGIGLVGSMITMRKHLKV
ncbi:MAG: permease-like cell division protein FtsX [Lachnospiraceae bacterium]|nr:permease-like cell division protein FtsX [Lachnospiraceae bacterium]